jgi:hypothetical protein
MLHAGEPTPTSETAGYSGGAWAWRHILFVTTRRTRSIDAFGPWENRIALFSYSQIVIQTNVEAGPSTVFNHGWSRKEPGLELESLTVKLETV